MAITVKKLISELEKIENKFLEVEIMSLTFDSLELDKVMYKKGDKKVFLNLKIAPKY